MVEEGLEAMVSAGEVKEAGVLSSDELGSFVNEFIVETGIISIRESGKGWQGRWRI